MNGVCLVWAHGLTMLSLALPVSVAFVVVGVTAAGIIVGWFFRSKHPEITILSIEKTLTIHDKEGRRALLQRVQHARVRRAKLTEFWCRNISADGEIENLLIDGQPPHEQRKEAGDTQVCKRFADPVEPGQTFQTTLSYEMSDAFRGNPEILIHVVEIKTKLLRLAVSLPEDRPCNSARALFLFGGQEDKCPQVPVISDSGCRIDITFNKPKLGAEYYLEWDW
jgi:hypothetical protein